jgi:hypothetical protein
VEESLLVNATIFGNILYLQNGIYCEGHRLITVTDSDGYRSRCPSVRKPGEIYLIE